MLTRDWNLYDTRHVVYRPAQLKPEELKDGYDWAYREFYRWSAIAQASLHHGTLKHQAKHFFYAAGWKKFEPLWDMLIRAAATHTSDAAAGRRSVSGDRQMECRRQKPLNRRFRAVPLTHITL